MQPEISNIPNQINLQCFDSDSFRLSKKLVTEEDIAKMNNFEKRKWYLAILVAFLVFNIALYPVMHIINKTNIFELNFKLKYDSIVSIVFFGLLINTSFACAIYSVKRTINPMLETLNPIAGTKLCLLVEEIITLSPAAKYIQEMVVKNRKLIRCDYDAMVYAKETEQENSNSSKISEACLRIHAG